MDAPLEPDPAAKPNPEKVDPQLTAQLIDRLRDGIKFPATVRTIAQLIDWTVSVGVPDDEVPPETVTAPPGPYLGRESDDVLAAEPSDLLSILKHELKLAADCDTSAAVFERIRDHEGELERLQRQERLKMMAQQTEAGKIYADVEAASDFSAVENTPIHPGAVFDDGPLGSALSAMQKAESENPAAYHSQSLADEDAIHTKLVTGGSVAETSGPSAPVDDPPNGNLPYGIEPGAPPFGTTRTQHPDPALHPGTLLVGGPMVDQRISAPAEPHPVMATFVAEMLAQSDIDAPSAFDILGVCMELAVFLMGKNKAYGDSALDPVRIMSSADPAEQLRVRMDDKLSRLMRGHADGEDILKDLVGYWVLMRVAEKRHAKG